MSSTTLGTYLILSSNFFSSFPSTWESDGKASSMYKFEEWSGLCMHALRIEKAAMLGTFVKVGRHVRRDRSI
ncbi:hypothetical protein H2248_012365 [Termitomyces sp. 'cryptogamus']|nr:hypothetical protein H2248_012365 [Termitomyces sp. 'cryptogamus']